MLGIRLKYYRLGSWLIFFRGNHLASWYSERNKNQDARFKLTAGHLRVEWW